MMLERESPAGHRFLAHTADLIIEAWAPEWHTCLAEAVQGLVESFADLADAATRGHRSRVAFETDAREPENQLVALLDEVIYLLDAEAVVPVDVEIDDNGPGLRGRFDVVSVDAITAVGPVPKAVTLHGLDVDENDRGWSCRVLIDV